MVQEAAENLSDQYIASRFSVVEDDWPPYQPKKYTTLALVHYKGKDTAAKIISIKDLATKGKLIFETESVSSIYVENSKEVYSSATTDISELFANEMSDDRFVVNPRIVLIEGAPGIGKTVLCKEIAYQWANSNLLNKRKLLFLLLLRNFYSSNIRSIEDFVQYILKSRQMATSTSQYIIQNKGEDLAIVLDGYDEMTKEDRKNSFISDIINRAVLPKCLLVITSRPTASLHLLNNVDCRVEIVGFTEEDRLDYIKTALPDSHAKVNDIQYFLHSNPIINALCYIPLNMTILLCLAENGINSLPKTQTSMYESFIKMTIKRFLQKTGNISCNAESIGQFELPPTYNKVFNELAHFAFEALSHDKLVFRSDELKALCPNLTMCPTNWSGLGLLYVVRNFDDCNESITYHFLHFAIQEYMAAYHMSMLPTKKQIDLLQNTFWEFRYFNASIMYVGITGGNNFAFRHFLSGNWFTISTRLFKTSTISKKLLQDKIKCLHMFQCLAEVSHVKVASLVGDLFKNRIIDLSSQTLLPRDLSTLAFFLIRSLNKRWEKLDLSRCNIGSNGFKILSDSLLLGKNSYHIINICEVDLSYNQLDFLTLSGLFPLLKSWQISEIIIDDNAILEQTTSAILFAALENTFNKTNLQVFHVGSFLFASNIDQKRMFRILEGTKCIESIYVVNCKMLEDCNILLKNTPLNIHIHDTCINSCLVINMLLGGNGKSLSLFLYNSTLSDQDVHEISSYILSKNPTGIMLVVNKDNVEGIIDTGALSVELSNLEILNLIVKVRSLCSIHISRASWSNDLIFYGNKSEAIIQSLTDFLFSDIICCHQLRIQLTEGDTFIAHEIRGIHMCDRLLAFARKFKTIYLSCCDLKYESELIKTCIVGTLSTLYLLNSTMNLKILCTFKAISYLKELFIHGNCATSTDNVNALMSICRSSSVILLDNDAFSLVVQNPTTKQLALAFQLQPFITSWKFWNCMLRPETFYLVLDLLFIAANSCTELSFIDCGIAETNCEIVCEFLLTSKYVSNIIRKLIFHSKMSVPFFTYKFVALILKLNIEELVICDDICFSVCNKLTNILLANITRNDGNAVHFVVVCRNFKLCLIHKQKLKFEVMDSAVTTLIMINCNLNDTDSAISNLPNLRQLYIINCTLHNGIHILKNFFYKVVEFTIVDTISSNRKTLHDLATHRSFFNKAIFNFCLVIDNSVCGYNVSENQLKFLRSVNYLYYFMNYSEFVVSMAVLKKIPNKYFVFCNHRLEALCCATGKGDATPLTSIHIVNTPFLKVLGIDNFIINETDVQQISRIVYQSEELKEFYFTNNVCTTKVVKTLIRKLQNLFTLKCLGITHSRISNELVDDLISVVRHNYTQLEYLDISNNHFQDSDVIKIFRALAGKTNLQHLCLECNKITKKAADSIATVILHNTNMKILNLNENNLQTVGMTAIARSLHNVFGLTELILSNNNFTENAVDALAVILRQNAMLRVLNLSGNMLQAMGMKKLANSLQNTCTLQKLMLGYNNATAEAADDLALVLSNNTDLQVLCLCGNNLQTKGILKLARSLQNITTLRELCLSDNNITKEAAVDLATALSSNSNLHVFVIDRNNLHAAGVTKIIKSLQNNNSLQQLSLEDNNATGNSADDIATVLLHNFNLTVLNLSRNNLEDIGVMEVAKSMQHFTKLSELYFSYNYITEMAVDDLAAVLSHNANLQVLYLDGNNLQASGIIKIAKGLQNTHTLQKLGLGYNNATREAAHDIANVLSHNTNLQVINLNGNDLQVAGVLIVTRALLNTSKLKELYLSYNNITAEAVDNLTTVLSCNTNLKVLCLDGNSLYARGIQEICKSLKNTHTLESLGLRYTNATCNVANDIAAVLAHNTSLQVLELDGNNLKSSGIVRIIRGLSGTYTLQKLGFDDTNATNEAGNAIAAVLTQNTNLKVISFNTNYLDGVGVVKIAKALHYTSVISEFHLSNNNITDEAVDSIAAFLAQNNSLRVLNLSQTNLQATGIIKVTQSLLYTNRLQKLGLSGNDIGKEAASYVAAVLAKNYHLQALYLDENDLQATGIAIICNGLLNTHDLQQLGLSYNGSLMKASSDIAAILSQNIGMQILDLSGNNLKSSGIKKIANALQKTTTLQELYIADNGITAEAADCIAAALIENVYLKAVDLNRNKLQAAGIIKVIEGLKHTNHLQQLGLSNNNATKEAAIYIAAVLSRNTSLQTLNIGGNDLQKTGVASVAFGLQNTNSLQQLMLGDNNATDETAKHIADVLLHNDKLKVLDLSRNNLHYTGVIKIAKSLEKISFLTELYFNDNNLQSVGICAIAQGLQNTYTLQKLRLGNNNIRNAYGIARILSHNTEIKELFLSGNSFGAKGIVCICKSLKHTFSLQKLRIGDNWLDLRISQKVADEIGIILLQNNNLQVLEINGNSLKDDGIIRIVKYMDKISTLSELHISDSNITTYAAKYIALLLSHSTYLQVLNLSGNDLQAEHFKIVAEGLQNTNTLQKLHLDDNNITEEAAHNMSAVLSHNTNLQVLFLNGNNLQANGIIKVCEGLYNTFNLQKLALNDNNSTEKAAHAIGTILSHNTELEELLLSGNDLKTAGIQQISQGLQETSTLLKLEMGDNDITEEGADFITAVLSHNTGLQFLDLSGNPLQATGINKVFKGLKDIFTLKCLALEDNYITEEAADDIATVLLHNTELQVLLLNGNKLQATGITKIARGLQNTDALRQLELDNNNATSEAADDIVAVIEHNNNLEVLSLKGNNLETAGVSKVARALPNISTLQELFFDDNNVTEEGKDLIANDIVVLKILAHFYCLDTLSSTTSDSEE